jgi:hypothetical protein
MANFIIDLFKKSQKNDSFRTPDEVSKYNDSISALNATNQNRPSTSKLSKLNVSPVQSSGNSTVPGR